jgi:hypothetical protein
VFSSRRIALLPVVAAALAGAAFLLPAAGARAGVLVASAPDCATQGGQAVFLPWADPASYVLAPNGGFEQGGTDWSLSGGAAPAAGNESFGVGSPGDASSLSLPAGSSATSASVCVGLENPTVRLFAKSSGSPLSALLVEVLFEDATGAIRSLPIGAVLPHGSWQPTTAMPIVANLLPLLPGDHTPVAFRLTPLGSARWTVDDLYVDPYSRN